MSDKDKKLKQHLFDAAALFSERTVMVPISPALDIGLGGGLTDGVFVTLAGPPALGKTITALSIAAEFQKKQYQRGDTVRKVFFYNVENRIKERDLRGILGLDISPEKFQIIASTEGAILHAEDYLEIADNLMANNPHSIHIFDSFSALCTEAEMTTDMNQMQRADGAKLLAKFCRKIMGGYQVNHNVIIGINHIMGNPSGKGAETKEKGGYATSFAADVKLLGKYFEYIKDPQERPIGQIVHWETKKTASDTAPGRKVTSYIRFGEGLDRAMEVTQLAIELSIITQKGAWYAYGEKKWQGQEKMRNAIFEDKELYAELLDKVKEML